MRKTGEEMEVQQGGTKKKKKKLEEESITKKQKIWNQCYLFMDLMAALQ